MKNNNERMPIKPIISVLVGLCLLAAAAYEAYRGYRHHRAVGELRELFAPVSIEQSPRLEGSERSRFEIIRAQEYEIDSEAVRPSESVPSDEVPRLALSGDDLLPTDRFVRSSTGSKGNTGDGSRGAPWGNLQFALNQLKPGNRLIVLNGSYAGKYVIGADAVDGKQGAPISVYFSSDATLAGDPPGALCDSPVFSVERSHWRLNGLNLKPQACRVGLSVGKKVAGLVIESAHISEGAGFALVVAPGASGIEAIDSHFHHLGSLEGKDHEFLQEGLTPQRSPFAAVKAPVNTLMMRGGKVHNIFGPLAYFVDEDGSGLSFEASELAMSEAGWTVDFAKGQSRWW